MVENERKTQKIVKTFYKAKQNTYFVFNIDKENRKWGKSFLNCKDKMDRNSKKVEERQIRDLQS